MLADWQLVGDCDDEDLQRWRAHAVPGIWSGVVCSWDPSACHLSTLLFLHDFTSGCYDDKFIQKHSSMQTRKLWLLAGVPCRSFCLPTVQRLKAHSNRGDPHHVLHQRELVYNLGTRNHNRLLTLWRPLLPYGTAIMHPVPDRVKPSFAFFDFRALWRSGLSFRVPGSQKLQMTA